MPGPRPLTFKLTYVSCTCFVPNSSGIDSRRFPDAHMAAGQNQRLVTRPGPTHATYPVTRGM